MKLKETVVLGVSIIAGFFVLGMMLNTPLNNISAELSSMNNKIAEEKIQDRSSNLHRYELISANDSNILIFDTMTGEYWRKFISSSEGPTYWQKEIGPDFSEE